MQNHVHAAGIDLSKTPHFIFTRLCPTQHGTLLAHAGGGPAQSTNLLRPDPLEASLADLVNQHLTNPTGAYLTRASAASSLYIYILT
jgi:hypothetical protein